MLAAKEKKNQNPKTAKKIQNKVLLFINFINIEWVLFQFSERNLSVCNSIWAGALYS